MKMISFLIIIFLLLIIYKIYNSVIHESSNTPPCLPRLPIIGSYWHLLWHDYEYPSNGVIYYVNKLQSKIVTCYFGSYKTIIANDYKSIKEVLTKQEFDGRAINVDIVLERAFGKSLGIFFTEGALWQEQRRFALRHMRDFGFGRRHEIFETNVMEEIAILVDMLKEGPINDEEKKFLKNGYAYFPDILYPYVTNVILNVMFGEKFDRSKYHKLIYFCESSMMFQKALDTSGGALFQFWFLKYFGNIFGYRNAIKATHQMIDFIKEYIDDRKNSDYCDRGLIDRYLKILKEKNHITSTFSEKQLIMTLVDFMFPATSTLPSALVHAIKLVMHHPRVMNNIQKEIDRIVGTGRLVTWSDRKNLPYTEATIRESLRYETLTPFSVFHKTLKKTTLCDYDIPKDTLVITNLAALNTDPDLWGDPENFRPERFLNENNELRKDFTFSFGFGHRVCAGETYSRYNMFEVLAVLMQNFNFSFVEGEPTGLDDKQSGLIVTPKKTWIRVKQRNILRKDIS